MSKYFFTAIEPNAAHWSITKLHKHQKAFLEEVVERSMTSLRARYPEDSDLYHMLAQTTAKERTRITTDPWICDPPDDRSFWERMDDAIIDRVNATFLLKSIVERYVGEISSNFSVGHYRWIAKGVHLMLIHLLKPHCFGFKDKKWKCQYKRLDEKLHITGTLDTIRALAKIGTIVLVPTHTSNWDSVIIGLAMQRLGLPPLSWGTGLNLFNHRGFRYIFSKLGSYKIDRRKKTIPYLLTQKHYTCLTLEWDCPTLFYPGGTRSRSGAIESNLKLGLLSTPFEAQMCNYQKQGAMARKIFFVPVVLNYHCVLEAAQLIREWAHPEDLAPSTKQDCCYTNLIVSRKILSKSSEIFINLGDPLDIMGNRVDGIGNSYDAQDQAVDLYKKLFNLSATPTTGKKSSDYVKLLSHKIVESYYRINLVLSSHLLAFVAYEIAKNRTGFSMEITTIKLVRSVFMTTLEKVYQALQLLYEQGKIDFTMVVRKGHLPTIVTDGVTKLGIYHATPPLIMVQEGDLLIQDLWTLYYYHNRLTGYGLEKLFLSS